MSRLHLGMLVALAAIWGAAFMLIEIALRDLAPVSVAAGRILFAGEHTQCARVGYADGAMTSGVREAKRLLSAPAVTLGRTT